jgi:hypothetical protein
MLDLAYATRRAIRLSGPILNVNLQRNTKSEIRPILSYRGSFPSYLVRTVKLRVRISSVTDAAALCRG